MTYNPYSIAKHTLLPLIYTIRHQRIFTYLLRDPNTKALVLLPSNSSRNAIKPHIQNIQQQFGCKLTHRFTNSKEEKQEGPLFQEQVITPQLQGDLRPFILGQLSICYIRAAGYTPDFNLVAVTHSSPTSTKFSVLFPGNLISVCSIDVESQIKASQYCETLNKLRYFPNQTLLFPSSLTKLDDLLFAQALQSNSLIQQKINLLKANKGEECLIPTSILSQKTMNPFLSPQKYSSLLNTTDKTTCFDLLRRMRRQWKRQL